MGRGPNMASQHIQSYYSVSCSIFFTFLFIFIQMYMSVSVWVYNRCLIVYKDLKGVLDLSVVELQEAKLVAQNQNIASSLHW